MPVFRGFCFFAPVVVVWLQNFHRHRAPQAAPGPPSPPAHSQACPAAHSQAWHDRFYGRQFAKRSLLNVKHWPKVNSHPHARSQPAPCMTDVLLAALSTALHTHSWCGAALWPPHTPWLEILLFQWSAYTYPQISGGDHINFSMTKRGCCSCSTSLCVLPCPRHSSPPLPSSAPPLSVCPINLHYFPPTQICTLLSIQSLLFRNLKQKRSYGVSWQEVPYIQQSLRAALIDSFLPNTKNGAYQTGEFKDMSFPEFHRAR